MGKATKQDNAPDGLLIPDTRELERQVLADIVSESTLMGDVRGVITEEMFANEKFRDAWNTINEMFDKGETIDLYTLTTKIDPDTWLLLNEPITAGLYNQTMDHCRALAEMATRRLVCVRAYEMMQKARDTTVDFGKMLSMPGDLVNELAGRIRPGATTQSVAEVLNEWEEDLVYRSGGNLSRVPTGIPGLDNVVFDGWNGGNLVVLSARPSVGKSAVMLQMAIEAGRAGFPATVYSLEMPNIEMGQRLCCSTGEVSQRDMVNKDALKRLKSERVKRAIAQFDGVPLYFNTRLRSMDEICNDIILQHQQGRCSIAFIDHLHIISEPGNRNSPYQQISEKTRRFKLLAMECQIPIVLLCQLNRMSETDNRAPELRDLRDSGSIEQDADIVLMLERLKENDKPTPDINMWVRKNRQGIAGVKIKLTGDVTRGFTVFNERGTE